MQFVRSDNCKTPLYITCITPNKMILRKNYLFEKIQVFAFHKIIAICRILMSEAWYTMDSLANRILCNGSVTIATKMLSFRFTDNSQRELSVYRKLSILVAMVTNFDLISYLQGYPSYIMLLTLKSCIPL